MTDNEERELLSQIRALRVSLGLTREGRLPPALYLSNAQLVALPAAARVAPRAVAVHGRPRLEMAVRRRERGHDDGEEDEDEGDEAHVTATPPPLQTPQESGTAEHPLSYALKELLSESLGSLEMVSHALALESPDWWVETTQSRGNNDKSNNKTTPGASALAVQPQQGWVEKQLAEGRPMVNFVGQTDALGPVTVSAVQEDVQGRKMVVALIRSAGGDQLVRVDAQVLKSKVNRRSMRVTETAMMLEAVSPVLASTADMRRVPKARESEMSQALLQHELEGKQTQYKFGGKRSAR